MNGWPGIDTRPQIISYHNQAPDIKYPGLSSKLRKPVPTSSIIILNRDVNFWQVIWADGDLTPEIKSIFVHE